MEITWLGHSCFRIRSKEAALVTDPYDKSTGYTLGKPPADVVTVSHDHTDHSNVKGVGGEPRVIRGPGEFEVSNVLITGVRTFHDDAEGRERGRNTAYVIETEDVRICHLGDLGHIPTSEQAEELTGVDILFIPIGGGSTIGAAQAVETVSMLGPKLVIPMHYRTPATKAELDPPERFLKEMSAPDALKERQPKLSVTRSTLPHETHVLMLEHKG
jgi:L-ascorbate metabolism protein UlaG (beta-lactamase superfamily)